MNREVQVRICEGLGVKLPGPTLPSSAVQQVGSYLTYTGRDANVVVKAARDRCCRKKIFGGSPSNIDSKMRIESASSIQKADSDDSVVARPRHALDFFASMTRTCRRRSIRLMLASGPRGANEELLVLGHGFTRRTLAGLVIAGLAAARRG